MSRKPYSSNIHTIIVGGGQAGLAVGYHLKKRGIPFLILDANPRIGDAWRKRWDSLRLFTPAVFAGLPGMPLPVHGNPFPSKDDIADYLVAYAKRFDLPVQTSTRVTRLTRRNDRFVVTTAEQQYESQNVVVAMSNYQVPKLPAFACKLAPRIVQLHANDYRNPSQLQPGSVLVVGAGNSAADISMEVAKSRPTWMAGKESGHVPFRIETAIGRQLLFRLVRFIGHHILSVDTPIGRKLQWKMRTRTAPLVRVKPSDLVSAGVQRVGAVIGIQQGLPQLADGQTLEVKNVIWCTGYTPGFSWIDLPIFNRDGSPKHRSGIVPSEPGLYFVGLHFLHAMSSATLIGVGRDADRVARSIKGRVQVCDNRPRLGPARAA
jgi:putative flavoprotein involved in K+ transport